MTDFVKFKPANWAEAVRILVDLADHPDQVATDTDDGFQLRIPTYLYDRWVTYGSLREGDAAPDAGNAATAPQDGTTPRKRGRPRKNPLPAEEGS